MNLNDKKFLREVGDRLRDRRQELQWTQQQLAEKSGLHRTFIGQLERGERNAAILNFRLVAKALRLSLGDLFEGL